MESPLYTIKNNIIKGRESTYVPDPRGLGFELMNGMTYFKDKLAQYIVEANEEDTFGDLLKRSIRTAISMSSRGLKKGDMVTICSHNHKNTAVPYIASIFLGSIVSCLDPSIPVRDVLHMLHLVKPKFIFVSHEGADLIEKVLNETQLNTEIIMFGKSDRYPTFDDFVKPQPDEKTFQIVLPDDLSDTLAVVFSSGTTGLPKDICLSHYNIMTKSLDMLSYLGTYCRKGVSNYRHENTDVDSVYLCTSAFYWVTAHMILVCSIFSGATRIVWKKFHVDEFWQLVDKCKATLSFLAPGQCIEVSKSKIPKNCDVSSVRVFVTGGGPLPNNLLPNLRKMFHNAWVGQRYGATEVCGLIACFHPKRSLDEKLMKTKLASCGLPVEGISYKVVDVDTEEALGPYQQGELRIWSKAMTTGYYNPESGTPFDENGWIKTGDLVYYDDDLCFYIVDRLKEMMKYKSWQIAPAMLEQIIHLHPLVKNAVVIGTPHPEDGDLPTAIVIPNEQAEKVTSDEIKKFVDERVEDKQKLRGGVRFVKQFPVTPSGKIRRRDLKNMLMTNQI